MRIVVGYCAALNWQDVKFSTASLCGSGSSTDVTISDRRDRSLVQIWCADLLVTVRLWPCGFGILYYLSVFSFSCNIFMSLSVLMWFFTVFEDAPLYNMFVNMFPFLRMSQGQNFLVFSFQTICLKPLYVQCMGGFTVSGGIKPVDMFINISLFS